MTSTRLLKKLGEKPTKKNKAVVDTSVIISAFAFGGVPEKAVKKVFNQAEIYVSQAILTEYRNVPLLLEAKGKINHRQLKALISGIASFVTKAKLVYPTLELDICRDPSDNIILECCLTAKANILITGDNDLLDIKNLPFKLAITDPKSFIEQF